MTSEEGTRQVQAPRRREEAEPPDPATRESAAPAVFQQEVRDAVRYEKGLLVKALIALALVAAVVLARLFYLG
jgi:hypothetical protein